MAPPERVCTVARPKAEVLERNRTSWLVSVMWGKRRGVFEASARGLMPLCLRCRLQSSWTLVMDVTQAMDF